MGRKRAFPWRWRIAAALLLAGCGDGTGPDPYEPVASEITVVGGDGQTGVAICTPVVGIPPRNVLVAFEKPFEDRKRGIAFGRGCCWGMRTILPDEFLEGVNRARSIRKWEARKDPYGDLYGR